MKHKYFSIVTKDVGKLCEFYKMVLHAEMNGIQDLGHYVEFFIEDFVFCVESVESVEKRSGASFAAGSVIIEFEADKVDEEHSRLRRLGIELLGEPFDTPWGTRGFYFHDPDGNLVCFYAETESA